MIWKHGIVGWVFVLLKWLVARGYRLHPAVAVLCCLALFSLLTLPISMHYPKHGRSWRALFDYWTEFWPWLIPLGLALIPVATALVVGLWRVAVWLFARPAGLKWWWQ
jgi:hypothetical protein